MASLRIENATILTMTDGAAPIQDGVIEVTGSAISFVGPRCDTPPAAARRTIDGAGCILLPGFINAHTHVAMTLFRGFADDMPLQPWLTEKIWPLEALLTEEDVYWGAMLGIIEMLRGGTTCFNDMYHFYGATTRAAMESGIRACPSGVLLGFLPNSADLLNEAVEFVKETLRVGHPRIHPMLGPHAPYTCPDRLLREVTNHARGLGVPIHIHLSETAQEVRDSFEQYGESPIAHMDAIGLFDAHVSAAHCVHLSEGDIPILAERGVGAVHLPGSNLKLGSGFMPVNAALKGGVEVALGTDGAASNNNLDMLDEIYLAAIMDKGRSGDTTVMPAATVLRMATAHAAQALGLERLIGTLEVGKRADMILVDMTSPHLQPLHNPISQLVYAARGSDVRTTLVDGQVLYHDGRFETLDEQEVIARAVEAAARLTGGSATAVTEALAHNTRGDGGRCK